jgi:type IV pilus assembly protein PilZ
MEGERKVVICNYENEKSLYNAFMPFIQDCGLFIRTKKSFALGDTIGIKIKLLDELDVYELEAKVVWVTPKGARGGKPQGIGLQLLGEQSRYIRNKIETYLAGMLTSDNQPDSI